MLINILLANMFIKFGCDLLDLYKLSNYLEY